MADIINKGLKQTVVFDLEQTPPQHLGWNSRLNGPADLNTTSCLSCHVAAQYPAVTPLVPETSVPGGGLEPPSAGGSDEWMKWFKNYKSATSMDPRTYSCDFSLQVVISLQNFFAVRGADLQGRWATEFEFGSNSVSRDGSRWPALSEAYGCVSHRHRGVEWKGEVRRPGVRGRVRFTLDL